MSKEDYIRDIVCSVIANECQYETIIEVLNHFIPGYEKINSDYCNPPDNKEHEFKSEKEMTTYFIYNKGFEQSFYWNKKENNPDKIMVGANIMSDDKLIISLTFDGNEKTKQKYYLELKKLLKSEIGVISYVNPPEYDDGEDFIKRYGNVEYDFEKNCFY